MNKIIGKVELRCQTNLIPAYIRDILTLNLCKFFFPVTFSVEGEETLCVYNTEGYRTLASLRTMATEDFFNVVIHVLKNMVNCEKHYIFSEEFVISEDTIFIDKTGLEGRMIYVPQNKEITGEEMLIELMEKMKTKCSEDGQEYIQNGIEYMKENGNSYGQISIHMEKLRKEVYVCGIS